MATGIPWGLIRNAMEADPEIRIRIREIRIFRNFFSLFSLLRTSWDLRVTPWMFRYHLIRIRTGKSVFSKIWIFRFFDFLSLKTLQYGCLWTRLAPTRSPVPVPRYCSTFSVLNCTFFIQFSSPVDFNTLLVDCRNFLALTAVLLCCVLLWQKNNASKF